MNKAIVSIVVMFFIGASFVFLTSHFNYSEESSVWFASTFSFVFGKFTSEILAERFK